MTTINGNADDNSLTGTASDDTINGLDGDDTLYGGGANDTLNGGNDNDYMDGGLGADTMNGGAGDDWAVASVGDTINGGTGEDYVSIDMSSIGTGIVKTLDFTAAHVNSLGSGTAFQNIEVLYLVTGSGNDSITYDLSAIYGSSTHTSRWDAGNGDDHAFFDWSDQTFAISGTTGGLTIGTTSFVLTGVERFDYYGGSGADTFTGGAENDKFLGNGGDDTLTGADGDDNLQGGDGNDTIYGGDHFNNLGIDAINAGTGDDTIHAAFKDTTDGGTGRDSLYLDLSDRSTDAILAFNPAGNNTVVSTSFQHIEQLYLQTGSGNDSLSFDDGAIQQISSTDGYWYGGGGNDTITVDFSAEVLGIGMNTSNITIADFSFTVSGIDIYNYTGGSGNDTFYGGGLGDTFKGNGGADYFSAAVGDDTVFGGDGRDSIYGGDDNDTLNGDADRDTMSGDVGKDKLNGGDGRDTLYGGLDNDTLKGNNGNDRMQGDAGQDAIDGGADADLMYYTAVGDSTGKLFDTIANFSFTEDKFHIGATSYGGIKHGELDNDGTFNADLTAALTTMAAHQAVLFEPTKGDFNGSYFVVVDANNTPGYQANEDYVVRLTTPAALGSVDVTDFTG